MNVLESPFALAMRLLLSLAFFAGAAAANAQDWPMHLRDARHSSAAPSQITANNAARLDAAWTFSILAPIASAPTLAGGTLYFGAWDGTVYALRATDGSVAWKQFAGVAPAPQDPSCYPSIGVTSQPVAAGGRLYVAGGDAALYALDLSSGEILSKTALADARGGAYLWSSITTAADAMYLGIATLGGCPLIRGAIARVPLDTPDQPRLQYLMPEGQIGAGVRSAPALDAASQSVFVISGAGLQDSDRQFYSGSLLRLDATTLEIKSSFVFPSSSLDRDISWSSSPVLVASRDASLLVAATGKDGVLYGVDAATMQESWEVRLQSPCDSCGAPPAPAFDGVYLYAGAGAAEGPGGGQGSVYCIDPSNGAVVWKQTVDQAVVAPVTFSNGLVFVSTRAGLAILDAAAGSVLWTDQGQGTLYSQPVVSGDTVYATYLSGLVIAWRIR